MFAEAAIAGTIDKLLLNFESFFNEIAYRVTMAFSYD